MKVQRKNDCSSTHAMFMVCGSNVLIIFLLHVVICTIFHKCLVFGCGAIFSEEWCGAMGIRPKSNRFNSLKH